MFQSRKGIYLLDRSLNVGYIGRDVEAFNSATITSSKLIQDLNQVRYSMAGTNQTLVYDYLANEWSTPNNPEVKDATIFQDLYTYIAPNGEVYQENSASFVDGTAPVLQSFTTGWLTFAGLQGFQRVRELLILGEYKSPHTLTINIAYDYESTYTQTVTIPVPSAPQNGYDFRVILKTQKCEAIQINISETQTGTYGEGMSLSALAMRIGVKTGLNKVATSQSYG
jgi:hypothetical protein